MNQSRTPLTIAGLFVILTLLSVGMAANSRQPVTAALPDLGPSYSLGETPLESPSALEEIVVVRAYFQNRQMVDNLATWIEPWEVHHDKGYLVVAVTPEQYNLMLIAGFRLETDQELTDLYNRPNVRLPGQTEGIPGYPCYRTVEETFAAAQALVDSHPDLATFLDVGDSWEKITPGGNPGYDMKVLRLTNAAIGGDKPRLMAMAAIHAREYTTAELVMRFGEYLINNYGIDPDVTWILDHHEVHLLLMTNPDGRKKAETGLSWRKNTNENYCSPTSNSRGADLNRNFSFMWGCCNGSSTVPCDELYRGPSAASEPETQVVQNYVRSIFPDQRGPNLTDPAPPDATGVFLDIHSYSQLVLWPWGFTSTVPPNGPALQTLGRKFAYFNNYEPQQSIGLYPTDGSTDDFTYGDLGLASYTFELGTAFFQSCSSFESTIYPQNLPALLYAARVARTPYMTPAGPDALNLSPVPNSITAGQAVQLTATLNDTRFSSNGGAEPTQNIAAAEYYIDVPPWSTSPAPVAYPMAAADGTFNANIENVVATVNTSGLSQGRHMIYVRGRDAANNWGPVSAAFLYVIDPAVAPQIKGYVRETGSNLPLAATVSAGAFQTTTNPQTGFYQMQVISDTYTLTASAVDHSPQSFNNILAQDYGTVQQNFSLYPICSVFSDDVEAGNQGWTAQTPWGITTASAHSPTHSWTDSPGGSYANNLNIALTSQAFDLSGFSGVTLSFWHKYALESGWDYGYIEYSLNGGTSWNQVASYNGTQSSWVQESISIPAASGQANFRLRFRLYTDTSITYDGWYLDDIRISGGGSACVTAVAPTAEFSSNSPVTFPNPIEFTNLSSGTPELAYLWDFGDGQGTSTLSDPTYAYAGAGTFTVTLTVSNTLGGDSVQHPVTVLPCTAMETVDLSITNPGVFHTGDTVNFSANLSPDSATKPYQYTVDYKDGTPVAPLSSSADPLTLSHAFSQAGVYAVEISAWNCGMSTPATDTVMVHVFGEGGAILDPHPEAQVADPGTTITYTVWVTNAGTMSQTFQLGVDDFTWPTTISSNATGALQPGTGYEFSVQVSVPEAVDGGTSDFATLVASSMQSGVEPVTATLQTTARAIYGLELEAAVESGAGAPGQTVYYSLTLTNTGNTTDTIELAFASQLEASLILPQSWLQPSESVTLGRGESVEVQAAVVIPEDAVPGDRILTTLVITSQGNPTLTSQVGLTTHVRRFLFLPVTIR